MKGFQLTFFTQQDRKHGGQPLGDWLVAEARRLGIGGATLILGAEGFGHHRRIHAARFFELGDQPVEVTMAVTADEAAKILGRLRDEKVNVFCVKAPIEFGMTNDL